MGDHRKCPNASDRASRAIFKEHELAHTLLDGLTGLEIGAAAHNPFGLQTRNVALREGYEFYAESQRQMGLEPCHVDVWAPADAIPLPPESEDFILTSHVVEHLPNLIAGFVEWDRIVRDGGYVFMIVPRKGALADDESRELTKLDHFIEDYYFQRTLDMHPTDGVPGGRGGHYHTFTPDSLLEVVQWMRRNDVCEWELVAREDVDQKVGNGFTLAFTVRHTRPRAPLSKATWRSETGLTQGHTNVPVDAAARQPAEPEPLYGQHYYDSYRSACGLPYERAEPWLGFFRHIAEKIGEEVGPSTVLDVGCAKGFLVEALRDRGVEAFGIDISEYAITQCREDIRPYCWVASVLDPFPRRYDLIVCIEVLEHLPRADAALAVANLCRYAGDILFSSTPDDFTDVTHLNVQPIDYWAALFSRHGFYRDVDFDPTFIAQHAVRFRKVSGPIHPVVRAYERKLWQQQREGHAKAELNLALTSEKQQLQKELMEAAQARQRLEALLSQAAEGRERVEAQLSHLLHRIQRLSEDLTAATNSAAWVVAHKLSQVRLRLAPVHTRRGRLLKILLQALKIWLSQGTAVLLNSLWTRLRGMGRSTSRPTPTEIPTVVSAGVQRSWGSRVLVVSGAEGSMERYRCYHAHEQLCSYGIHCDVRRYTDSAVRDIVPHYDLLILHRVPYSQSVQEIVDKAHAHKALVLFDIDDLVFDRQLLGEIDALRHMQPAERELFIDSVRRYRGTVEICDAALVTTDDLAEAVVRAGKPAWIHRQSLSFELMEISAEAYLRRTRTPDRIVVGYASGSRTHNRDFQEITTALRGILPRFPQVQLWIIGYLDLDEEWAQSQNVVKHIPFVPWRELPSLLAQLDINVVPLETNSVFCQSKSEIKYIEAAAVGVPTIASKVGSFRFAIRHGENGLLAGSPEEWVDALERLITDPTLRAELGAQARADVLRRYHPATRGSELLRILDDIVERLGRTAGLV